MNTEQIIHNHSRRRTLYYTDSVYQLEGFIDMDEAFYSTELTNQSIRLDNIVFDRKYKRRPFIYNKAFVKMRHP
jgi:hypothetical protein